MQSMLIRAYGDLLHQARSSEGRAVSPSSCLCARVKVSRRKTILFPGPGSSQFICQYRLPGNFPLTLHRDPKPPLLLLYNIYHEKNKKSS